MSIGERIGMILNRTLVAVCILAGLGFIVWISQEISANFARQELIEEQKFGELRAELDENFSGREIETAAGKVVVFDYSDNQNLDTLYFDQASDLTLMNSVTGKQLKVAGDDRRVIWFQEVVRPVLANGDDATDGQPSVPKFEAVGFVARLATREDYVKGTSDLVVGNLETLEQKEIAQDVPFVDTVSLGTNDGKIAILYWDSLTSARHVVVSLDTFQVERVTPVDLPEIDSFELDMADPHADERDKAIEAARTRGGRPKPPGFRD